MRKRDDTAHGEAFVVAWDEPGKSTGKKCGFTMKTPLAAKSLSKARSKAAKKRGLPEKLKQLIEARRQVKAEAKTPAETSGPGAQRVKRVRQAFRPKKMS